MSPPPRLLALRLSAGLLLLPPAAASAAPDGEAEPSDAASDPAAPSPAEAPGPAEPPAPAPGPAEPARPTKSKLGPKPGPKPKLDRGRKAKAKLDRNGLRGRAEGAAKDDEGLSKRTDRPWLQRWGPERNMVEVGVFGGLLVPARDLELFRPRLTRPRQGFLPLATVAPEVGARVGYYPLRFVGIEAEGAYMPTSTLDDGYPVSLWAARGHVVGQLPFSSITPFVVVGGGVLSVSSNELFLGNDIDQAFHLGIGAKIFIDRRFMLRLDLRDEITPRRGINGGATNSIEALLGLSIVLGRMRDRNEPEPEPKPEPKPAPKADRDGDGFLDDVDACPTEPGVAPDGCSAPGDQDGDGFLDDVDACPAEPGVAPDGCPDPDPDGDGVLAPDDACPDEPESFNGFEDGDGCPDEVPDAVKQFSGRLQGVNFELSRATLTKASLPILDKAVEVLQQYPTIRIEISGHTDNSGSREINMRLSQSRAEAVRQYLVDHGVDEARIVTRGAGPDEPIDSNASREGRANNRRIEFRVLE